MMGRGHALMGATAWLVGCAADAQFHAGHLPAWPLLLIGTPVCAGWALAPDIDHPNSTITHSAGPFTMGIAAIVAGASKLVHAWTRTPADYPDSDGHRTVTHTILGALIFGVIVAAAGWLGGRVVAALLVFWPAHLGISTILTSRRRAETWGTLRIRRSITDAAVLAAAAAALTPGSAWWLGLAAGGGMLIHIAGDMLTDGAVPAAWPIPLRDAYGRTMRWKPIGLPRRWRFHAGGPFELRIVHPLLWALSAAVLLLNTVPLIAAAAARLGWSG